MSAPQPRLDGDGAGPSSITGASSEVRAPTGNVPPVQPARAPPVEPAPAPVDADMAERGDAAHAANVASAQPSAVQAFGKVMAETLEYERLVATLPSLATSLSVFQHKPRVAVREVMERLASLAARGGVTRPGRDAAPGGRLQSIDRQVQRLQNEVAQLRRRVDAVERAPAPPPPNRCGGGGCCGGRNAGPRDWYDDEYQREGGRRGGSAYAPGGGSREPAQRRDQDRDDDYAGRENGGRGSWGYRD